MPVLTVSGGLTPGNQGVFENVPVNTVFELSYGEISFAARWQDLLVVMNESQLRHTPENIYEILFSAVVERARAASDMSSNPAA